MFAENCAEVAKLSPVHILCVCVCSLSWARSYGGHKQGKQALYHFCLPHGHGKLLMKRHFILFDKFLFKHPAYQGNNFSELEHRHLLPKNKTLPYKRRVVLKDLADTF